MAPWFVIIKGRKRKKKKTCGTVCTVHWTAKNVQVWRGTWSKRLKKSLHCIRAVSQQVSLKLSGWMAGLKWLDWDGGRDGWCGTLLSPLSLSLPPPPPPLFLLPSLWHIQPSCLYFFPFKLGKRQTKWRICTDVTQASFAPLTGNREIAKKRNKNKNLHQHLRSY